MLTILKRDGAYKVFDTDKKSVVSEHTTKAAAVKRICDLTNQESPFNARVIPRESFPPKLRTGLAK